MLDLFSHLKFQEYAYLTITGEGDAQQIAEQYGVKTRRMWNAGDVEQTGHGVITLIKCAFMRTHI